MRVAIYSMKGNRRNQAVTIAMQTGIAACQGNEIVTILDESHYTHPLPFDVVCFYGLSGNLMRIFKEYRAAGIQTVFVDLGIWGRKGEREPDFHRVAVDSYMPTAYFRRNATPDRFRVHNRDIKPWTYSGEEVLVVGMSERAAQVWGFGHARDHAAAMIAEVRKHTGRPIAYTTKALSEGEEPIPNVRYALGPIKEALRNAWIVVTYRSHVSVDGLIEGIPCIVLGDHPAQIMSHNDLTKIEEPLRLPDPAREQFCADLAWTQFSLREMRSGYMWRTLKKQGLIKSHLKESL